jgi:methionyl-tRNA formyltransferase
MKIIFFGTSNPALPILESLSREHEILAVVTQPDAKVGRKQEFAESPVSVLAAEMKLKIFKPENIKGNDSFRLELENLGADIYVVVAFGRILPKEIYSFPKYKTVNVHFSLLPKYRGPSPIQTALLNGEKKSGTSVFLLDEEIDHGPILFQQEVDVDEDDNYITLSEKMALKSSLNINGVIDAYIKGTITPKPQDDFSASNTQIVEKKDGQINWNSSAQEIYNKFRAFYPWPGIWTKWNGKIIKILDCVPASAPAGKDTGTVLDGGNVICGNKTALQIKSLQLEGKKETNISDFLNGYKNFVGSCLG